jgi:hypothetical protein
MLKQDIINRYTLTNRANGSIGFLSGTLTLVLPTTYASLSKTNLTAGTNFLYKGTELTATLNNKQAFNFNFTISGATGGTFGFSARTFTLGMPNV